MTMKHNLIGGQWTEGVRTYQNTNPSDIRDIIGDYAVASREQALEAVAAAHAAFPAWSLSTPQQRFDILDAVGNEIIARKAELGDLLAREEGKTLPEAIGEVGRAGQIFKFFAGECLRLTGETVPSVRPGIGVEITREPIGVVGQIVPWNFPFLMAAWKLAPVLASGCCTVLKPSKTTSLSVLYFADLIKDVLPPGVFNVITGAGSKAGQYMLDHKGFCKLAFTGSTEVGLSVAKAAAEKLIPATLELGGKSANIFFADCNLEQAYDGAQLGILFNQGQVCCAGSRVFVQEGIFDKFVAKLKTTFEGVKVGDPTDPSTQLGAQIYKSQQEKVLKYIKIGLEEGGELVTGGERYTENGCDKGFFLKPTILISKTNAARVCQEEIFGPVMPVLTFDSIEEVIRKVNSMAHPLALYIFAQDKAICEKVTSECRSRWSPYH